MPDAEIKWDYAIQLLAGARLYRRPGGEDETVYGWTWALVRTSSNADGSSFTHSVIVSPEVFENDEEAKHDALEKLTILRCPIERPLDVAAKMMVDS
ncbi:MAG: hypothetical protein OXH50_15465 [Gemmatimonadetes bacterium]|nr:hypothetical protein [Gemmatimonadota bacterium]